MEQTISLMSNPATRPAPASEGPRPRTVTLQRAVGPMAVDIWEPRAPADVPPILLVHGWGGSGQYWRDTAIALSETARVIVPDLPGTGRSLPVHPAQNMYDQVATLAALLDEVGAAQVQVVGHSMGGAMALLLADRAPERVERLALVSTCFFLNRAQEQIYRAIMQVSFGFMRLRGRWQVNVRPLVRASATRYFFRVPDDEALLRQGFLDYLTMDFATAVACANNACDATIPQAGARVRVPTLLIACRQDRVMPVANVGYTASLIPRSQVHWIDRCGHIPMVEKPDEFRRVTREFLRL